jgi:SAM-dependent MidA family methyltransferase
MDLIVDDITPLEIEIHRRIAAAGAMPVGEFMALCLTDRAHGYYTTRDPLGERGDFITSPEISQMFGELIGLWMAAVWKRMGEPGNVRVIELGPGRGTMMNDALRAAKVLPAFRDAAVLHLVSRKKPSRNYRCRCSGTQRSATCRADRPSSSPTNSSTHCRSTRRSRPSTAGTSG